EGVREGGELAGRVRMGLEEERPVERAQAHRGVLEARARAAEGGESLLDELPVVARLVEVLREDGRQRRVALRTPLQQRDGLFLDRVCVGEVGTKLLAEVVRLEIPERRRDGAVEACLETMHHRAFLRVDPPGRVSD